MTIAHFLVYERAKTDTPVDDQALRSWFAGKPLNVIEALDGVQAVEIYTPDEEDTGDPYNDDGPGPVLMVQTDFETVAALEAALGAEAFRAAVADTAKIPIDGVTLTHDAMEVRWWPVGGDAEPKPRTAPMSYVVRYFPPAEDEQAFRDFYVANHPQILAKLPKIRNVLCYLPIDWRDPTGIPQAGYMLGNEVVFDSVADLHASMKSDIRLELRDDYRRFPAHGGNNTHHAMMRQRVFPKG